jgi:hypothetical protein
VIVGRTRVEFKAEEVRHLLEWVEAGGRLVVIDRIPEASLIEGENWLVSSHTVLLPERGVRADDTESLTRGATQLAPAQPTLLTRDVASIAPSRYASRLLTTHKMPDESADDQSQGASPTATGGTVIVREDTATQNENDGGEATGSNRNTSDQASASNMNAGDAATGGDAGEDDEVMSDENETTPSPLPSDTPDTRTIPYGDPRRANTPPGDAANDASEIAPLQWNAPVFHISDERGALLVDFARGRGRVIVLSDPFIVANGGINRADNLQLAANIITGSGAGDGLIAFDEFHQGRGTTRNQFAAYFAGTPILAMCAQLFLIAAAIVWTRGRRFARPLPAPHVDRRSKLEFVASMAELQQRARAFDLAIENIYGRTRRALARYGGSDASAPRADIAAAVAARSGRARDEIESLMRECEDAINGAAVTPRQSLALAARLRELERALGIRMRTREIKQAGAR